MPLHVCLVEVMNGHLVAQSLNPAVPYSLLGYKYHTWKEGTIAKLILKVYRCSICITTGKSESITDNRMRSILAQLEFKYRILERERQGVPFREYIYVPKIHPVTQQVYFETEDEPHVFNICVCVSLFTYVYMLLRGSVML